MRLLAGVAHGLYVEYFPNPLRDPLWDELILNRPPNQNGRIELPEGPGFGWKLNLDANAKYRVADKRLLEWKAKAGCFISTR